MDYDEIRPSSALLTGLPGGLALVGSYYFVGWIRDCLLAIGVILTLFSVVILFFWSRDQWARQAREIADARDRIYLLAKESRNMTSEQLAFINNAAHIGKDITLEGETYLHGTDAPLWFVAEFLSRSFTYRVCPIRSWSEGSEMRKWAQQITSILTNSGYALVAIGNQSAPWVDGITPETIAKKLGIALPSPTIAPDGWKEIPG